MVLTQGWVSLPYFLLVYKYLMVFKTQQQCQINFHISLTFVRSLSNCYNSLYLRVFTLYD